MKRLSAAVLMCGVISLSVGTNVVKAQDGTANAPASRPLGDTCGALPGVLHIGSAAPRPAGLTIGACAGYGYTEDVLQWNDSHHRIAGTLGVALRPIDWLAIALRFDGRFDSHSGNPPAPIPQSEAQDDGLVGDPRLTIRAGGDLGGGFTLGGQLVFWVPGIDAPSFEFSATTIDFTLMAAYQTGDLTIAFNGGFRLDNSANAAPNRTAYKRPDQLSLMLSQYHALILGLAASYRVASSVELMAEWSWDLLLGAPSVTLSPMRITLGGRFDVSDDFFLQLLATYSPSARLTNIGMGAVAVPVEPVVSVTAGLGFRVPFSRAAPPPTLPTCADNEVLEGDRCVPRVVPPTTGTIAGRVTDTQGAAVGSATVTLAGETPRTATTDADGRYTFADVAPGAATLTATRERFRDGNATATVVAGQSAEANFSLESVPPTGQLRGVIRGFDGQPVAASIAIAPSGQNLTAGSDGTFQVDLPPGDYQVSVTARGFADQQRRVSVQENGVTVLNVDLRRARGR